jgi:hypothetical protein
MEQLEFTYIVGGFFFLMVMGFELRAFTLAKQRPYHLSHTSSPFCSGCFEIGVCFLPRLALNGDFSDASLLRSSD